MSDKPFIQFFPSDFLAGTSGLSPAERGIYITLLCLMFEADGPIPWNTGRLARRCGTGNAAFKKALQSLIAEGKIRHSEGMLFNKRAQNAILQRNFRTENARAAAQLRWSAEGEKTVQNQSGSDAAAMPGHRSGICQPEPEPEPESKGDSNESPNIRGSDAFDLFWQAAPRKVAKGAAAKAFHEALQLASPNELILGMHRYARSRQGQPEKFTKFPSTWLRDMCWKDQPDQSGEDFHSKVDEMLGGSDGLSGTN